MADFKPDDILDILPIDNVTEELSPIYVSKTIEVHESIPGRARCNPVALGWVALLEGLKRRHVTIKRPTAITGPGTFTFHAATDQSFFVLGVLVEFSGSELTPSSPFDITLSAVNNGVTITSSVVRGDIKDIRAGENGQRNMVLMMFTIPIVQYGIPTTAAQVVTSSLSLQEATVSGLCLAANDVELADLPKVDVITVTIGSVDSAYKVGCQLLAPGNSNFDALVNGLFKHELKGGDFSVASFFAEMFK